MFGNGGPRTRNWGVGGSLYSWSFHIEHRDLRRFDILIRPAEHVMLFDDWDEHGRAVVWEMGNHPGCRGYKWHSTPDAPLWEARRRAWCVCVGVV